MVLCDAVAEEGKQQTAEAQHHPGPVSRPYAQPVPLIVLKTLARRNACARVTITPPNANFQVQLWSSSDCTPTAAQLSSYVCMLGY